MHQLVESWVELCHVLCHHWVFDVLNLLVFVTTLLDDLDQVLFIGDLEVEDLEVTSFVRLNSCSIVLLEARDP